MLKVNDKITPLLGPPFGEDDIVTGFHFEALPEGLVSGERLGQIDRTVESLIWEGQKGKPFAGVANLYTQDISKMTEDERDHFDRKFAVSLLVAFVGTAAALSRYKTLCDEDFSRMAVTIALNKSEATGRLLDFATFFANLAGREGPISKLIENIAHDQRNILTSQQYLSMLASRMGDPETRQEWKQILARTMDPSIDMLLQIYHTNLAIIEGHYPKRPYNLRESLVPALARIQTGTGYDIADGQELEKGKITVKISPDVEISAHSSSIAILIFNLLKNPTGLYGAQQFPISLDCCPVEPSCVEITVRDHGLGINITELRKALAAEVLVKIEDGEVLSPFEKTLVDPAWTPYIPEAALTRHLFSRGTSLRGSSGIGLAIAKTIVDGHDGDIRITNHPEGGTEVKILLPNTEETDRVARYQLVHKALLNRLDCGEDQA